MTDTPVFGFGFTTENDTEAAKSTTQNENWLIAEALFKRQILDRDLTAPPGGETNGDMYIVQGGATGAWAGQDYNIALYYNGWIFIPPVVGPRFYLVDEAITIEWAVGSPNEWAEVVYGAAAAADTFTLVVAASDETTALTTGAAKVTFRMPAAVTLTAVRASLTTANTGGSPTTGPVTVDINEGGVSILSTKLTIDDGETTSTTAATPAVISDANLADDAEMTIDIDVAGEDAAGLKVALIGTYV